MIMIFNQLNSSGPRGSYKALLIRTLAFGLSEGNLIKMMIIDYGLTFTLDIVVMIIVVMIKIITMMSDVPMGPSMVRNSASQKVICII